MANLRDLCHVFRSKVGSVCVECILVLKFQCLCEYGFATMNPEHDFVDAFTILFTAQKELFLRRVLFF